MRANCCFSLCERVDLISPFALSAASSGYVVLVSASLVVYIRLVFPELVLVVEPLA
jgi:hypothetical protein